MSGALACKALLELRRLGETNHTKKNLRFTTTDFFSFPSQVVLAGIDAGAAKALSQCGEVEAGGGNPSWHATAAACAARRMAATAD